MAELQWAVVKANGLLLNAARLDVHKLRSNNQAIMTGSGTIINDNPKMTARLNEL